MKNTITEIKNTLEGIKSRLYDTEERSSPSGRQSSRNHPN